MPRMREGILQRCLSGWLAGCSNDWRGGKEGLGEILGARLHNARGMLVAVAVCYCCCCMMAVCGGVSVWTGGGDVLQHLG